MLRLKFLIVALMVCVASGVSAVAQEKSVKPGINDAFRDPNVDEYVGKFEVESREVYAQREKILAACNIQPGQTVADIGAGTGLYTRLFAKQVGQEGRVIAVDIARKFLDHIEQASRAAGITNVETVQCQPDSTSLPANSIDVAFICDTYHHFEFPHKTMTSLHQALKPGGRVIVIDFQRKEGQSRPWVIEHVRAGQDVFEQEITAAGFRKLGQPLVGLSENYMLVFEKVNLTGRQYPLIAQYGGVVVREKAVDPPRAGTKVVFDITGSKSPRDVNAGLERVARLLNLYGAAGLKATDVQIVVVVHGDATRVILTHDAYRERTSQPFNPNLELIRILGAAGVEIQVCGQALANQEIPDDAVAEGVGIATSAMTTLINKQADGFSFLPVH